MCAIFVTIHTYFVDHSKSRKELNGSILESLFLMMHIKKRRHIVKRASNCNWLLANFRWKWIYCFVRIMEFKKISSNVNRSIPIVKNDHRWNWYTECSIIDSRSIADSKTPDSCLKNRLIKTKQKVIYQFRILGLIWYR